MSFILIAANSFLFEIASLFLVAMHLFLVASTRIDRIKHGMEGRALPHFERLECFNAPTRGGLSHLVLGAWNEYWNY